MAERVPILPFPAACPEPNREAVERGVRALRREFEAQSDVAERASLSHELARIHESRGDLAAAARDELQATNLAGGFVEPLESLISIAVRSRSKGNTEKLLVRLLKVSRNADQMERAGVELACHRMEADDWDGARDVISQCLEAHADSQLMWLLAEVVAGCRAERDSRVKAALGRAAHSESSELRALFLERVARLQFLAGEVDDAMASLIQSLDERPTLQRLRMAERFARESGDGQREREMARQIAALVEAARIDAAEFDALSVPIAERTEGKSQAARFRVAMMQLWHQDVVPAREQLADLVEALPNHLALLALSFVLGRTRRDGAHVEVLERALQATSDDQVARVFLLTTHALELRSAGEGDSARAAVDAAAALAPGSAAVRALEGDLSAQRGLRAQASHLVVLSDVQTGEASAGPSEEERARLRLAAAILHLLEGHYDAARQALRTKDWDSAGRESAVLHGLLCAESPARPPRSRRREFAWATARPQFLNGESNALAETLGALPRHDFTLRIASALWPLFCGAPPNASTTDILDVMTEYEPHADAASVLGIIASLESDTARSRLLSRWHQDRSSPLLSGALVCSIERNSPAQLPETARSVAERLTDFTLEYSLRIRTLLLLLRERRSLEALELLEESANQIDWYANEDLSNVLLWLRRAVRTVSGETMSSPRKGDPQGQLEQAVTMVREQDSAVLDYLEEPLSPPAALLKLLVAIGRGPAELDSALAESSALNDHVRGALLFASGAQTGNTQDALLGARRWVELSFGVESQLAWMTAARMAEDNDEEARALRALSQQLGAPELLARSGAGARPDAGDFYEYVEDLLGQSEDPSAKATLAWELLENCRDGDTDQRAYVLARLGECLGSDPDAATARLQAAYINLTHEHWQEACDEFGTLIEVIPEDPSLWLGLGVAAFRCGDVALEARAMTELARRADDHLRAAAYWERAGDLYERDLNDPRSAESAFTAALSRVPGSPHAFERLYRLARSQGDKARLIELIDARLDGDPPDAVERELLWQKARLCRHVGRRAASLKALKNLLAREPSHLQALALSAELHLVDGNLEQAADVLCDVCKHPDTPREQLADAGLFACDLLEKLQRPREALALLRQLEERGIASAVLRQRRARAAARAGQWDTAYAAFSDLSEEDDIETRLEAARMMLAIQRDYLRQPAHLEEAARKVLRDSPEDDDAIDVLLDSALSGEERERLLWPAREACRSALVERPLDPPGIARLAVLCEGANHPLEERVALGILGLTGRLSDEQSARLLALQQGTSEEPLVSLSEEDRKSVASIGQLGTLRQLATLVSASVARMTEPSLSALGISSSMRIDPFVGHPVHMAVARWVTVAGVPEFELYVGGEEPRAVALLQGELPTFVVGTGVGPKLSKEERARLSALAFCHAMGTAPLVALPQSEATTWLAAAARLGKTPIEVDDPALVEEKARALAKTMTRDERETLQELCAELSRATPDVLQTMTAARAGALKMACLVHGDPSIARAIPEFLPDGESARETALAELVRFALSDKMRDLRNKLGLEGA